MCANKCRPSLCTAPLLHRCLSLQGGGIISQVRDRTKAKLHVREAERGCKDRIITISLIDGMRWGVAPNFITISLIDGIRWGVLPHGIIAISLMGGVRWDMLPHGITICLIDGIRWDVLSNGACVCLSMHVNWKAAAGQARCHRIQPQTRPLLQVLLLAFALRDLRLLLLH